MTEQGYNATSVDQVIAESSQLEGRVLPPLQLEGRPRASGWSSATSPPTSPTSTPASPPPRDIEDPHGAGRGVPPLLRGRRRRAHVRAVRLPLRHRARRAGVHRQRHQRPGRQGASGPGATPWPTCCARRWPPAVPTSTSTSTRWPTTCTPPSRAASSCAARSRTAPRCAPSCGSSASWSKSLLRVD